MQIIIMNRIFSAICKLLSGLRVGILFPGSRIRLFQMKPAFRTGIPFEFRATLDHFHNSMNRTYKRLQSVGWWQLIEVGTTNHLGKVSTRFFGSVGEKYIIRFNIINVFIKYFQYLPLTIINIYI